LYPRAPANSSSSTVAELKQRRARGSAATGAAERMARFETDRNILDCEKDFPRPSSFFPEHFYSAEALISVHRQTLFTDMSSQRF